MAKRNNLPAADVTALESLAEQYPKTQPDKGKRPPTKIKPAKVEPDSPLTVKIPGYVHRALKIKSAETGKTQREILLEALKGWGIEVDDSDIIDRRKA